MAGKEKKASSPQTATFAESRGSLRKIEILEAALKILSREGLDGLTLESIGKACDIGKSHVLYHFPERTELLISLFRYAYGIGQAIVIEYIELEKEPAKKLEAYVRGSFHWITAHPHHGAALTLVGHLSAFDGKYREFQKQARQLGLDRIEALLKLRKYKKKPVSYAELANQVQSLLMGNLLYLITTGKSADYARVEKATLQSLNSILL